MLSSACASVPDDAPDGGAPRARAVPSECWVELRGRVVAGATVVAPLSGDRCALYQVEVGWRELLFGRGAGELTEGRAFELEPRGALPGVDGRPLRVRVDPSTAVVAVPARRWPVRPGLEQAFDQRLAALCARLGRRLPRLPTRWRERRVLDGEELRIRGWLSWQPAGDGRPGGYREPPRIPALRAALLLTGSGW